MYEYIQGTCSFISRVSVSWVQYPYTPFLPPVQGKGQGQMTNWPQKGSVHLYAQPAGLAILYYLRTV